MSIAINFCGPSTSSTGYGSANRAFVAALYMAGVDLTVEKVTQMKEETSYGWEGELSKRLEERNIPYKIKIIHLTCDLYQQYMEPDKYHIGFLMWETDKLPIGWASYCNKMGEIWTTSPFMVELFKKSGVKVP